MTAFYYDDRNPAGMWLSEKLDGIRAGWDGRTLWSRQGLSLPVPCGFTDGLPAMELDGELYLGRGRFGELNGMLHSKNFADPRWQEVRLCLFDAPSAAPVEARLESLCYLKLPAHVEAVKQTLCEGRGHLARYFESIIGNGGEGVVLRQPRSLYVEKRSPSYLKLKPVRD